MSVEYIYVTKQSIDVAQARECSDGCASTSREPRRPIQQFEQVLGLELERKTS
jgi:hypothetical protein